MMLPTRRVQRAPWSIVFRGSLFACLVALVGIDPALGKTVYVAKTGNNANNGLSWTDAKADVQEGLNTALAGDQVWVAAGTYVEVITLNADVELYGGFSGTEADLEGRNRFANLTILDGGAGGSVVSSPPGATATTRIDGFTIRNGQADNGGGIHCSSSSPSIVNNIITANVATGLGSGIYCTSSSPLIANNTISGNSGAVFGGGIVCNSASSPMIANNAICGNTASGGGGIACSDSSPLIMNNVIVGNMATMGAGIFCNFSSPTIANTIVAFNSSGIRNSNSGTPILRYNCVHGNTTYDFSGLANPVGADGNISADPLFRSASFGLDGVWGTADDVFNNLRLRPSSPCIDAANNADVPADSADLDSDDDIEEPLPLDLAGWARIFDDPATTDTGAGTAPIVDMGAFEFFPTAKADFDGDGDVDGNDMMVFEACATGPAIPYNPAALPEPEPGCTLTPDGNGYIAADFDEDNDVDQSDFGSFQRCYSGDQPAAANCAD